MRSLAGGGHCSTDLRDGPPICRRLLASTELPNGILSARTFDHFCPVKNISLAGVNHRNLPARDACDRPGARPAIGQPLYPAPAPPRDCRSRALGKADRPNLI